jgi:hypothetical protein
LPTDTTPPSTVRLIAAEERLSAVAPGYLFRTRQAARRLGVSDVAGTDARAALAAVDELAVIDLDVPTRSQMRVGRMVKVAVKRLVGWYLGYFGRQVSSLGQAVSHLGAILVDRTEQLEKGTSDLEAEVARLSERVARLEHLPPGRG